MRKTDKYVFFWRTNDVYSQWHPSEFTENGVTFKNCEQYMMYHKAMTFNAVDTANEILQTTNPAKIKALGRQVKDYSDEKWFPVREQIVYQGNYLKFTQNPKMQKELLDTGDLVIVEASPVDFIWGIGMEENDIGVHDPKNWKGQNLLGIAITKVKIALLNKTSEVLQERLAQTQL